MKKLGIAAIGGKDSMSGTFKDLNVPPTLIAFAVTTVDVAKVVSPEFKENTDSVAIWLETSFDDYDMPDFVQLIKNFELLHDLIEQGKILAAHMPGLGGIAAGIGKMCLGNGVGFSFSAAIKWPDLVKPRYGSFILQLAAAQNIPELFKGCNYKILGKIQAEPKILLGNTVVLLNEMKNAWQQPLEKIFPTNVSAKDSFIHHESYRVRSAQKPRYSLAKPRVIIPVFPGSNCEYDSETAFERAGAAAESFVFRNLFPEDISGSLKQLAEKISQSQIIMIPGGFSSGDEPDGSGKFIAAVFRNPYVTEEVLKLIHQRDGLILGVCNGFQALVKLGLVPFGDIRDMKDNSPTLTFNTIGRHVSCMARTKVVSVLSPWFLKAEVGDIHAIPISHGEGRFIAEETLIVQMFKKGQVAAQYVDLAGNPTMDIAGNPNGSLYAIEAITSPDGRILGKMAHSERIGNHVARNIPGNKNQPLFESAVYYFS
jgi:phosphoribosylformylglycinamidine synthase